jgi:hypothetical protein
LIFFAVSQPVTITRHELSQQLEPQSDDGSVPGAPSGYVTSMYDLMELQRHLVSEGKEQALQVMDEDLVLASGQAPVELGTSNRGELRRYNARRAGTETQMPYRSLEKQLHLLPNPDSPRIAIINGFGTGIGDHIVGLTAWRVARDRMLQAGCSSVSAEIWSRTHGVHRASVSCTNEPSITGIRALPVTCRDFMALDAFWDLSGLLDRPSFWRMPTIDFYLETLGVDPSSVAAGDKRNKVRIPAHVQREIDIALNQIDGPFVLLHPTSSTPLRDMPVPIIQRVSDELTKRSEFRIASLHELPVAHEQYVNLSGLFKTHQHFCAVIRRAAGLLTIDTSTYHIADAFDVPSLVIFTTVPPERWIPYYPTVEGFMLKGVRESKHFGMHRSNDPVVLNDMGRFWEALDAPRLVDRFLGLVRRAGAG